MFKLFLKDLKFLAEKIFLGSGGVVRDLTLMTQKHKFSTRHSMFHNFLVAWDVFHWIMCQIETFRLRFLMQFCNTNWRLYSTRMSKKVFSIKWRATTALKRRSTFNKASNVHLGDNCRHSIYKCMDVLLNVNYRATNTAFMFFSHIEFNHFVTVLGDSFCFPSVSIKTFQKFKNSLIVVLILFFMKIYEFRSSLGIS